MENNVPQNEKLIETLDKVAYTLDKAYIGFLKEDYDVAPFKEYQKMCGGLCYEDNIRVIRVKRWVKNSEESIIDCFKNILGLFSATGGNNVALVVKRTPKTIDMFFVLRNIGESNGCFSKSSCDLLMSALEGNFNGTVLEELDEKEIFTNNVNSVATVCGIPSEKSEKFVTQGIEKLLEGVIPQEEKDNYMLIVLAEPLASNIVRDILNGYEEIATSLTPFATKQNQYSKSDGENEGTSEADSATKTVSAAITRTHSVNISANVGGEIGPVKIGGSVGYGYSRGKTDSVADAKTKTKAINYMLTRSMTESDTYTYKSYPIINLVEKTEKTIKRIQNGQANGLWRYASYVLSKSSSVSQNVAGYITSLAQGDDSYIELPIITEWSKHESSNDDEKRENYNFNEIYKYVKHFSHPIFVNAVDKIQVTPTSYISTSELAALYAFPKNSTQGLPVIEGVRFGREPHSLGDLDSDLDIGCAYHMYHEETQNRIVISKNELTKHTFVTGSTGSGKSNTIYKLLDKICLQDNSSTNFLVVEPAKGEYKKVLGGYESVIIYGTNPYKFPHLLQLNPFSFPVDEVHVLEHIDRLVEVFNACWAMYAAMPAVLREAVEKSYEAVGWSLRKSKSPGRFPTFDTLLSKIPKVVDSSKYSDNTSNDYKGALVTRIRSLTIGIQGQMFEGDMDYENLFNKQNAIIDISRVGSSETKALIMGILILKLQEFRMAEDREADDELRHITVLEEAHNILRRTSSEQTQESSNLQGKSVEMLANAIAEMRTYGEGFIIADQSPGLMDMSVVRNTNTKIIMRLPDESDRMLVGKAAGLSDIQIHEISRLGVGVAAISQSGWLEPVLSKIDRFTNKKPLLQTSFEPKDKEENAIRRFLELVFNEEKSRLPDEIADSIRKWSGRNSVNDEVCIIIERVFEGEKILPKEKAKLILGLFAEKLRPIFNADIAVAETKTFLIGECGFDEQDEIVRRITENLIREIEIVSKRNDEWGGCIS